MRTALLLFPEMLLLSMAVSQAQNDTTLASENSSLKNREINGFIRGGLYYTTGSDNSGKPAVSTIFSDLGLRLSAGNGRNYKAVGDLRFRYGTEFSSPVNKLSAKEGYINLFGKNWDLSAGQKIIKWGRADFTNPTSKLNPQNYISRSPDREDMDLGNLLLQTGWSPVKWVRIEAVAVPVNRPSVLLVDPIPLPSNVIFNQNTSLYSDRRQFSYGLRSDFHFTGIDFGISWFDGYDPNPGIALTAFSIDMTDPLPVVHTELSTRPYRIRMTGIDFETSGGDFGIRGEAAFSSPALSYSANEYIPYPELRYVAGVDWSSGIWKIIAEYSGKNVIDYAASEVAPFIGTSPDYARMAQLLQTPGFDMHEYVRQQVAAFNRLYNYQLRRMYHSAGLKAEADLYYGKLVPSVFSQYNFTSRDLLVIPELRIKPSDGLAISVGAEYYKGKKSSLYDIIDGFMNTVYVSLRVDF